MKYILCVCSLLVCGISITTALLEKNCMLKCFLILSASISLFVALYGLYANNKRDKRIKQLQENCITASVEGTTLNLDKVKNVL